ncbi:MAG TPA: hypothetical protein VKY15_00095, partial [Acidimicrobiales bacterium]|nr:hypothetical protein [Acidimicrobiales bacterium]
AVFAVEPDPRAAGLVEANARSRGVAVEVVRGRAPQALAGLPDPDRVFVGGGGLEVLRACLDRLRPGGRLAATFAAMDRAVAAHRLLGSLVQLDVAVAEPLPDGGLRLRGGNPVFLAWGPGGR